MIKMTTTNGMKADIRIGWKWVRLDEVCEVRLGKMLSPASKVGHRAVPYLRNANVQWNRFDLTDIAQMVFSEEQESVLSLRAGDLLVCEGGEPGRAAVWEGQISRCCYQKALHRLRPINAAVDPYFVMYRLWRGASDGEFTESNGKTTIAHLPAVRLKNLKLAIPSVEEQRRIARLLREQTMAIEKARAAAQARLEAIRQLPLAYYREAFGESSVFAASPMTPTKPTRPGWRWHRLMDLARLATGHTPSRYHPEYWNGNVPWIQLADIRALDGQEAFDTSEHTNELGVTNSAAVFLPKGTVCMSRTASVGFFAIMGRPMTTSQDFVNWVCGTELDSWFLLSAAEQSTTLSTSQPLKRLAFAYRPC
jgi:type I restriction enzyme S subunit